MNLKAKAYPFIIHQNTFLIIFIEQEEDKNPDINGRLDRNANQNLHGDALENMSTKSWPPRYLEPRKILSEKQKKNSALYSEFSKMFRVFNGYEPDITNTVFADRDVQSRVEQDKVLRKYGVKNKGKPSFLIFTITKDYELIWEIYLDHYFDDNILNEFRKLLWMSNYIYLFGIERASKEQFDLYFNWIVLL